MQGKVIRSTRIEKLCGVEWDRGSLTQVDVGDGEFFHEEGHFNFRQFLLELCSNSLRPTGLGEEIVENPTDDKIHPLGVSVTVFKCL